jgi:hypothetical protein
MNTVVTCTGDRPVCLSLLIKWMNAQTIKPDQWLIIEDGKTPISEELINAMPEYADIIRREPLEKDPKHTLCLNMKAALPFIEGNKIIFCEDDEYYAPRYIEVMSRYLESYEVVGIGKSRYYHLPSFKYFIHGNCDHASLAQTGISKSFLPELKRLLEGDSFIDVRIWNIIGGKLIKQKRIGIDGQRVGQRGFLFDDAISNEFLYVGMKGLPGRAGIGCGHQAIGTFDNDQKILKKWIPLTSHLQEYLKLELYKRNGRAK